jgi:hypothetical protein
MDTIQIKIRMPVQCLSTKFGKQFYADRNKQYMCQVSRSGVKYKLLYKFSRLLSS